MTYTPAANFSGTDAFSYTVKDADGLLSNVATVDVSVNPVIIPPVAVNDSITVPDNTSTVLNILANDTDQNGTLVPTSVAITTALRHRRLVSIPRPGR